MTGTSTPAALRMPATCLEFPVRVPKLRAPTFLTKPAVRRLGSVELGDAVETLRNYGFHEHDHAADRTVLKKPGARFSPRVHQKPFEAVLSPGEGGLELELRYDVFVAFDTGDLDDQADRLARAFA